jgi:tetratricopeptide (TPR) repeat protein
MAHTRNAALAARIAELGLTEKELSYLLNDAIEQTTGQRGKATDRYIRLLLNGTIQWPWPVNRRALEQVLGRSILELGFVPRGQSSVISPRCAGPAADGAGVPAGQATPEATMERREVLGFAAGATVSIVVPALPQHGRLGLTDVARLREPLAELVDIDQRLGGVAMARVCVRQADRVLDAVRRFDASDRVERALYGLVGEYLAAAAWACVDAMELDEAGRHLDRALHVATIAQDPMLHAKVTNIVVMRCREAGDVRYAHAMAKSGVISTAARANPRLSALFHARVAHGHAHRGELGMARRALGRAQDALARVTPQTPTPPWLRFVDQAELAALANLTYHVLGRYPQAIQHGELATSQVLPGHLRNQTLYTLGLADSLLSAREVEQAAARATEGLQLAQRLREGVHRGRVARRLRQLRARFAQWPDVPEARAWVAAFDQASAQAATRAEPGHGATSAHVALTAAHPKPGDDAPGTRPAHPALAAAR